MNMKKAVFFALAIGLGFGVMGGFQILSAYDICQTAYCQGSGKYTGACAGCATTPTTPTDPSTVPEDAFQLHYFSNLAVGDGLINMTNAGSLGGESPAGRICANVYVFDPAEELIACCACSITPNGLVNLQARRDLISNTLTPGVPSSITVKLLASSNATGSCNAASVSSLAPGLRAWGTTLHAFAVGPVPYAVTETPFLPAGLSDTELAKLTSRCGFIQNNGSGYGICRSCTAGGI